VNRSKSFAFFVLFLACFCFALTVKFQFFVVNRDESNLIYAILAGLIFLSGYFLGLSLRELNQTISMRLAFTEGLVLAVVALFGVTGAEKILSHHVYVAARTPESLAQLSGHCGIHAGRAVLKIFHAQEDLAAEGAIQEFQIKDRCRLHHLGYLMEHKHLACQPNEEAIECQIRWMSGVSEHGYWSHSTRKFFFEQVMKSWDESKKEEALVNYVIKDQELENGRQSILRQAGIDETLNDRYLLLQEKEELENLMLTRDMFNQIEPMLSDAKVNPQPYLFKFKDTQTQVMAKLAKIPELEKEIQGLQGKTAVQ
jgi:hypothetical protein